MQGLQPCLNADTGNNIKDKDFEVNCYVSMNDDYGMVKNDVKDHIIAILRFVINC